MELIVTVSASEALAGAILLAGSACEEVRQVNLGDGVLRVSRMEDFIPQLGNLMGGWEFYLMRRPPGSNCTALSMIRLIHGITRLVF